MKERRATYIPQQAVGSRVVLWPQVGTALMANELKAVLQPAQRETWCETWSVRPGACVCLLMCVDPCSRIEAAVHAPSCPGREDLTEHQLRRRSGGDTAAASSGSSGFMLVQ